MNVAELIDILRDLDQDAIVEMAIVAPVTTADEMITVDQYVVEGILPAIRPITVEKAWSG